MSQSLLSVEVFNESVEVIEGKTVDVLADAITDGLVESKICVQNVKKPALDKENASVESEIIHKLSIITQYSASSLNVKYSSVDC